MSQARDLIYSFVNKLGDKMAKHGPEKPWGSMIEAGSGDDDYLHGLLNWVEDDRAHREAEKLRQRADGFKDSASDLVAGAMAAAMKLAADEIDPYEERDGQLVRKSDGKPVML